MKLVLPLVLLLGLTASAAAQVFPVRCPFGYSREFGRCVRAVPFVHRHMDRRGPMMRGHR